jgi:hypothetical protein
MQTTDQQDKMRSQRNSDGGAVGSDGIAVVLAEITQKVGIYKSQCTSAPSQSSKIGHRKCDVWVKPL